MFFVAFLTALFSFRAFFVIFRSKAKKPLKKEFNLFFPIVLLSIISTIGGVFLYFFNGIISIAYSFDAFSFIALAASLLGLFISYEFFYLGKTQQLTEKIKGIAEKIAPPAFKVPIAKNMKARLSIVEYASIFLKCLSFKPSNAPMKAVINPMTTIKLRRPAAEMRGRSLTKRYAPAATIVAE